MFQRFGLRVNTKPVNREQDYAFHDICDAPEEDDGTPEKVIITELNRRKKLSPIILKPLRPSPEQKSSEESVSEAKEQNDFVVEFEAEQAHVEQDEIIDQHARFDVYSDMTTPIKQSTPSVMVSPLPVPDTRFRTDREKKLRNEKNFLRSPLARMPENKMALTPKQKADVLEYEDVEADDGFDVDLLFSRIRHNRLQFVVEALEKGCNAYMTDSNGNSMLHVCAQNNNKKIANLCIKYGCDINAINRKGMTPLDYADMLKFSALAEWMVAMGAESGSMGSENKNSSNQFNSARTMR